MKRTEEQYNEYITIIIEKSTGRADITLKVPDGNVYYYAEKKGRKWELKFCENGFWYNATLVEACKTLKECIEIIRDVCKDLTDHYRAVEDEEPVEEIDKAHEIFSNPLTELDVRISAVKSALNSVYGKQSIDAKNGIIRTELTGYHVSGVMSEIGIMMLSCDIYAQDLDITESYLAYNVGSGYAVYDEISLTRVGLYPHAEAVRQFFVIRFNELETRTIETLY